MSNPQLGRLLLAQLHFDSAQDAEEFYQAFQAFMTPRLARQPGERTRLRWLEARLLLAATEGTQTRVQTVSDTGQL